MGTGLPHSILAWAQDCHTQSSGLLHPILLWQQDCHTQSWRGHRIATLNPGVGTGLPHSILAWAQDCSTQSCCGNRIAPPNPAVATGLLHPILLWQQDCPTQSWRGHRIAPVFPRKRWKRSAVQHYAPRLAARIARKTPAVRRYTAMHSRTRRPDCPENYGSALLYSRTLPEKTGCDAVNMAFLPGSPPFPASNLASNAKEMGKIKLFPTTEYSSKQASDPVVPWCHARAFSSGRQNRAKPWL